MDEIKAKRLPLPGKKFALVSPEDFDKVSGYKWYQHSAGYVFRWRRKDEKQKTKAVYLHKEIMPSASNMTVKFRDDNKLNCVRTNLFVCTKSAHSHHNTKHVTTSKYDGVFWDNGKKKWVVTIRFRGKPKYIGSFHKRDEKKAALARDYYSRLFYKDMANLNFPDQKITKEELREMLREGSNKTSTYRGVSYHPKVDMWRARITHDGKRIDLGLHKKEEDAAKAYDKKSRELYGDSAYLNFG